MLSIRVRFLVYIFLVFSVSGCKRHAEYFTQFPQLQFSANHTFKQDDLIILAKIMNEEETHQHFGVNLINKGYLSIRIRIINTSSKNFALSPSYIALPLVSSSIIAELLHYDTYAFMVGTGTPAFLFFWPATLVIGAEGYDMYKTNQKIDELAKLACLDKQTPAVIIAPYDRIDKFMFIEKTAFVPAFELKLYDLMQKQFVSFTINLEPQLFI
jgi:hypothetical protein